jgi:para-aminobenzoate synthetase component 1
MQSLVVPLLESWGYRVTRESLTVSDLSALDGVIATNALMGAVPVLEVDGVKMAPAAGICTELNEKLGIAPASTP